MKDAGELLEQLAAEGRRMWLFLDYDGTLKEFAPTPEHVEPDPALIDLLTRLAAQPRVRMAIISGRSLAQIERLVPVPGTFLAGTYGIEMRTPAGERIHREDYDALRPTLDALKPRWQSLVAHREGFFVEDKGWALALHARFAEEGEAEATLEAAQRMAAEVVSSGTFRLLGGHRFLEVAPSLANKGRAVDYLLHSHPWRGSVPVYLGDDDKDEEAFRVIKRRSGVAIVVAAESRDTQADARLPSPEAARQWLRRLLEGLNCDEGAASLQ